MYFLTLILKRGKLVRPQSELMQKYGKTQKEDELIGRVIQLQAKKPLNKAISKLKFYKEMLMIDIYLSASIFFNL